MKKHYIGIFTVVGAVVIILCGSLILLGRYHFARRFHSAVSVHNQMYVFGGDGFVLLGDLWKYDPSENIWVKLHPKGDCPPKRFGHSAVAIGDRIYVFGGHAYYENYLNDMWVYNVSDNKWTKISPLGDIPSPRRFHRAVAIRNSIYLLGGDNKGKEMWVYDVNKNAWSQIYPENLPDFGVDTGMGVFAIAKERLYAINLGLPFPRIWKYDPSKNSWANIFISPPPNQPLTLGWNPLAFSAVTINDSIYVLGGWRPYENLDIWKFDTASNTLGKVSPVGSLPPGRYGYSVVTLNNKIYAYGGCTENSKMLKDLWMYDPINNNWRELHGK